MTTNPCLTCAHWNQLTTTLKIDPKGYGNAPTEGGPPNTDFGQCRPGRPTTITPGDKFMGAVLQWSLVHKDDHCGEYVKKA